MARTQIVVPNLDALSADPAELREAGRIYYHLSRYASAKAQAMELRARGKVPEAWRKEASAEAAYIQLPHELRWEAR